MLTAMTDAAPMPAATARMMTLARTTPGYPAMMPVSPAMASDDAHGAHYNGASADHPVLPFIGHCYSPVWLGVVKGARPRRSGPAASGPGCRRRRSGSLALGRQVGDAESLDALRADVDMQLLHVLDHHLG